MEQLVEQKKNKNLIKIKYGNGEIKYGESMENKTKTNKII